VNAHPFEHGDLVGAHNGTLVNQLKLDDNTKFDVDSDNLFYHMSRNEAGATIPIIHGAFALSWWDKGQQTLNLVRNSQRPLYFCRSEDRKTVMWASEDWMLSVAAFNSNVKIGEIFGCASMTHYRFDIDLKTPYQMEEIPKPVAVLHKEYIPPRPPVYHPPANQYPFRRQVDYLKEVAQPAKKPSEFLDYVAYLGLECEVEVDKLVRPNKGKPYILARVVDDHSINLRLHPDEGSRQWNCLVSSRVTFQVKAKSLQSKEQPYYLTGDLRTLVELITEAEDDIPFDEEGYALGSEEIVYPTQGGIMVTSSRWLELVSGGCAWCGDPTFPSDAYDIEWFWDNEFLCTKCKDLEDAASFICNGSANH